MEVMFKGSAEGKVVVAGFPGVGLVGPIVCRHIVEKRNMPIVGHVLGNFPPVAGIKGGVVHPPVSIYADRELIVVYSDVFFDEKITKDIARTVTKFFSENGAKMLVSVAGIVSTGAESVYGVCSREEDLEFLVKNGIRPVEKGTTTGISAAFLLSGMELNFPVILLLGHLHMREDFRAAADVILKLDEIFGLNVDVGELLRESERIEKELHEVISQRKDMGMYG